MPCLTFFWPISPPPPLSSSMPLRNFPSVPDDTKARNQQSRHEGIQRLISCFQSWDLRPNITSRRASISASLFRHLLNLHSQTFSAAHCPSKEDKECRDGRTDGRTEVFLFLLPPQRRELGSEGQEEKPIRRKVIGAEQLDGRTDADGLSREESWLVRAL